MDTDNKILTYIIDKGGSNILLNDFLIKVSNDFNISSWDLFCSLDRLSKSNDIKISPNNYRQSFIDSRGRFIDIQNGLSKSKILIYATMQKKNKQVIDKSIHIKKNSGVVNSGDNYLRSSNIMPIIKHNSEITASKSVIIIKWIIYILGAIASVFTIYSIYKQFNP